MLLMKALCQNMIKMLFLKQLKMNLMNGSKKYTIIIRQVKMEKRFLIEIDLDTIFYMMNTALRCLLPQVALPGGEMAHILIFLLLRYL